MNKKSSDCKSVKKQLKYLFRRNGYLRLPNKTRRKKDGQKYKKGYEIRFVAKNEEELTKIRDLLSEAGFKTGRPFSNGTQLVQPVYGKKLYEKFRGFISNKS